MSNKIFKYFSLFQSLGLPNAHQLLHTQTGYADSHPATGANQDSLTAIFDHFANIGAQTNGCHRSDNEKFGQGLQWFKDSWLDTCQRRDGGDDRSCQEK